MPPAQAPPQAAKGKGNFLQRVPKWAWLVALLIAVAVFWYFKHHASSAASTAAATDTSSASPTDTASLGGTPDMGSGGDTSGSGGGATGSGSSDGSQTDYSGLIDSIQAQQDQFYADFLSNIHGLLGAGIGPAGPAGPVGPAGPPGADQSVVGAAAAGLPHFYTYKNQVPLQPGQTLHFQTGRGYYAAAPGAPAPTRYYTYKSQVPLQKGQTLHFTAGKGYYSA